MWLKCETLSGRTLGLPTNWEIEVLGDSADWKLGESGRFGRLGNSGVWENRGFRKNRYMWQKLRSSWKPGDTGANWGYRRLGRLGRTEDSGASGNREKLLYEAKIENLSEPRIGRFRRFGKHWDVREIGRFPRMRDLKNSGKYLNVAKNERCGIANLERYVMLAPVGATQQEKRDSC